MLILSASGAQPVGLRAPRLTWMVRERRATAPTRMSCVQTCNPRENMAVGGEGGAGAHWRDKSEAREESWWAPVTSLAAGSSVAAVFGLAPPAFFPSYRSTSLPPTPLSRVSMSVAGSNGGTKDGFFQTHRPSGLRRAFDPRGEVDHHLRDTG